ncbi:MAG: Rubrerythrin [Chitinivibrionales bacterium]|nr:Rubrerythrin [Chitinivibrionales bacterium]
MPEFVNPFTGLVPDRKITTRELLRGLRLSLSAEEEATHLYEALADATDNPLAKAVLQDVANEERVHKGEFQRLISILAGDEQGYMEEGAEEVDEMRESLSKGEKPVDNEESKEESKTIPTIGDLKSRS